MSLFRRAGAAMARIFNSSADPAAEPGKALLYAKDVTGVSQLFARASDGTINQITPALAAGGVFVWTAAKTWAQIYAEMNAAAGPKICLVEAVAGGRTMTAGAFNINHIYFWGMEGVNQGGLDTNGMDATIINVDDGFTMSPSVDPEDGVNVYYMRSKDIYWVIDAATTPLYTITGFNQAHFLLERGYLESASRIGSGRTVFVLSGATVQQQGGAGLVQATTSGNIIVMTAGADVNGTIFEDDGGAWNLGIEGDPTLYFDTTVISAPGTKSVNVINRARKTDGTLWNISISAGNAVVAAAV